jgi:hypothetical protein
MGKKKQRKTRTSKGIHSSTNRAIWTAVRTERSSWDEHQFKLDAWKSLQNPWITVENPNKSQTNRKFIRVRANEYYGPPRAKQPETVSP